jgi:hypothetical protein
VQVGHACGELPTYHAAGAAKRLQQCEQCLLKWHNVGTTPPRSRRRRPRGWLSGQRCRASRTLDSASRSRRCTPNSSCRTWHVGAAVKCCTASVSCHTNRGREIGTEHAASNLSRNLLGRGACSDPLSRSGADVIVAQRGNNPMRCGSHLKWTAQHRPLGKRPTSSLAPALMSTSSAHPGRN